MAITKAHQAIRALSPWERVKARCVRVGACLVWQGATIKKGYGVIRCGPKNVLVHRIAYEHACGPIPAGLTIDHVKARGCIHKTCCEPTHLEAVTKPG